MAYACGKDPLPSVRSNTFSYCGWAHIHYQNCNIIMVLTFYKQPKIDNLSYFYTIPYIAKSGAKRIIKMFTWGRINRGWRLKFNIIKLKGCTGWNVSVMPLEDIEGRLKLTLLQVWLEVLLFIAYNMGLWSIALHWIDRFWHGSKAKHREIPVQN